MILTGQASAPMTKPTPIVQNAAVVEVKEMPSEQRQAFYSSNKAASTLGATGRASAGATSAKAAS